MLPEREWEWDWEWAEEDVVRLMASAAGLDSLSICCKSKKRSKLVPVGVR